MKETWKPLPIMPSDYNVSDLGLVRSIDKVVLKSNNQTYKRRSKILKPSLNRNGYHKCAVSEVGNLKSFFVHRQVAIAFIPNPENKETVNHKNGIKTDNRVVNLEWMTRSENCQHSFDAGLQKPKRGVLNGMAKLSKEQVLEIKNAVSDAKKEAGEGKRWGRRKIAERFNIKESHLKDILNRTWQHI